MPTCRFCDEPITLRGDEFYGAHIACAKTAMKRYEMWRAEYRDRGE